jgi:hypothetical protein
MTLQFENISIPSRCSVCKNIQTGHLNMTQVLLLLAQFTAFTLAGHPQYFYTHVHKVCHNTVEVYNKKHSLVWSGTGPEGSRRLRVPDFETVCT